jgi:hypothetical protein
VHVRSEQRKLKLLRAQRPSGIMVKREEARGVAPASYRINVIWNWRDLQFRFDFLSEAEQRIVGYRLANRSVLLWGRLGHGSFYHGTGTESEISPAAAGRCLLILRQGEQEPS